MENKILSWRSFQPAVDKRADRDNNDSGKIILLRTIINSSIKQIDCRCWLFNFKYQFCKMIVLQFNDNCMLYIMHIPKNQVTPLYKNSGPEYRRNGSSQ